MKTDKFDPFGKVRSKDYVFSSQFDYRMSNMLKVLVKRSTEVDVYLRSDLAEETATPGLCVCVPDQYIAFLSPVGCRHLCICCIL